MAPTEPLVGARLIARFMAAVSRVRSPDGELESRMVKVNGQPGRVVRGPAERPLEDAERIAAERALVLMTSGELDSEQLSVLMKEARGADGPTAPTSTKLRVRSVLTVDVVDGRIQAVRVVRNPDKLQHL
jgi:RNA polymerase sigma-70 factor (ECF subfamily)